MRPNVPRFSHLLLSSPGIPFQARAALRAAEEARDERLANAWRRRAAYLLGTAFDLDECEQYQLVDLDPDCGRSLAA